MATNLRHLFPSQDAPAGSTAEAWLRQARITAEIVLDSASRDPRLAAATPGDNAPAALPASPAVIRSPPRPLTEGMRLLPLDGFFWGGATRPAAGRTAAGAAPRVRGDHVLILVQRGCVTVDLPRLAHPLMPGRLAFVPAGTAFALQPGADCRGLVLLVPPSVAQDLAVALPPACRCGLPGPADAALVEPTMRILGQRSPGDAHEKAAAACQLGLLSVALERLGPSSPDQAAALQPVEAAPLTQRFLALAEGRLDEDLAIADLACDLGCTAAQLDHACRAARGRSPLELVYALRLDRAARLLRETDQPVAQIAQELGYSGIGHFMRCFMAGTGQTPDHFRAAARSDRTE